SSASQPGSPRPPSTPNGPGRLPAFSALHRRIDRADTGVELAVAVAIVLGAPGLAGLPTLGTGDEIGVRGQQPCSSLRYPGGAGRSASPHHHRGRGRRRRAGGWKPTPFLNVARASSFSLCAVTSVASRSMTSGCFAVT